MCERYCTLPRERTVSDDLSIMGNSMGGSQRVFQLSAGNPEGDLHDKRGRIAQFSAAESNEKPIVISE